MAAELPAVHEALAPNRFKAALGAAAALLLVLLLLNLLLPQHAKISAPEVLVPERSSLSMQKTRGPSNTKQRREARTGAEACEPF